MTVGTAAARSTAEPRGKEAHHRLRAKEAQHQPLAWTLFETATGPPPMTWPTPAAMRPCDGVTAAMAYGSAADEATRSIDFSASGQV